MKAPALTTYVRCASARISAAVKGKSTYFSWLNSRVWSTEDGRVVSVARP